MNYGVLLFILLATFINSLVSLLGSFSLFIDQKKLEKIIFVLVSFSAGTLLSGAFFHLLAESLENFSLNTSFLLFLTGFVVFFLIEKFLYWHHCHKSSCKVHPVSYLILFGDGIHNFIDGLVIAISFFVSPSFGFVTTLLIISHEIPQELGDFAVLVYSGFSRKKALIFNFLSQLTCIVGGIIGFFASFLYSFSIFLLPVAAGGFLYISASDLIPELHKETNTKRSLTSFLFFLFGIAFLILIKYLTHTH